MIKNLLKLPWLAGCCLLLPFTTGNLLARTFEQSVLDIGDTSSSSFKKSRVLKRHAASRPEDSKAKTRRIATCTSKITDNKVTIDFFEDITDSPQKVHAGKGIYNILAPDLPPELKDIEHRLRVKDLGEKGTEIELYAALDENLLFAKIVIPAAPTSKVEIFAIGFNQVWGIFDCTRSSK